MTPFQITSSLLHALREQDASKVLALTIRHRKPDPEEVEASELACRLWRDRTSGEVVRIGQWQLTNTAIISVRIFDRSGSLLCLPFHFQRNEASEWLLTDLDITPLQFQSTPLPRMQPATWSHIIDSAIDSLAAASR